ncbi:hypothetical protein [uncultured Pontibacter sp.]|uniref:hypothetical protein n=1 Tax=uncultured Pontibacter sp. TaxID=453356 RepID=UPI0026118C17|nr:hypothetical protein [uncultured Pontibacter sp.]
MKKLLYVFAIGGLFTFASCDSNTENRTEEGMEEVGDGADELGDDIEEGAEDVGDGIEEGAEEVKDEVQ